MNCALRQILDRLTNRGERRPDDFRHWRVVEAGYGYRRRDIQRSPVQRQHCARGHVIVGTRKGGDVPGIVNEPFRSHDARLEREVAGGRPRLLLDARFGESVEEAFIPQRRRLVLWRPLDEAEAAVSKRREMLLCMSSRPEPIR